MRKTYKHSHHISQGGSVYIHRSKIPIANILGLKNVLHAVSKKFGLLDVTIKVYNVVFFMFCKMRPSTIPNDLRQAIQRNLPYFGSWDDEYVFDNVYDLQEPYVRKYLQDLGLDYDKG